jgi:hypothetical protein
MTSTLRTLVITVLIAVPVFSQKPPANNVERKTKAHPVESQKNESDGSTGDAEKSDPFKRLLQSNGILVEGAYHQEGDEVQHSLKVTRSNDGVWRSTFSQEWPLFSEKHQLSFQVPSVIASGPSAIGRGFGDTELEYSYFLFGNNSSRLTVSPTFELSLPTGNVRKDLGLGHVGFGVKLPLSAMLSRNFQSNSNIGMSFTPSVRNGQGERSSLKEVELGQSFAWLARSRFNLLFEATWERSWNSFDDIRETEQELFLSPGVRWAHKFRNGFIVAPGVAFPIGIGPSRGERSILFYIAFEHPFKKRVAE